MYLEKLANGVNPLTDKEVNENDVVNNVRISRCLYYAAGILKQITATGGFEIQKTDFTLSPQQLAHFEYSQTPLTVSEITKRLNNLVNCCIYCIGFRVVLDFFFCCRVIHPIQPFMHFLFVSPELCPSGNF